MYNTAVLVPKRKGLYRAEFYCSVIPIVKSNFEFRIIANGKTVAFQSILAEDGRQEHVRMMGLARLDQNEVVQVNARQTLIKGHASPWQGQKEDSTSSKSKSGFYLTRVRCC